MSAGRRQRDKANWHTRGRADAVLTLIAAGMLRGHPLAEVFDLLNLDRVDLFHAQRRANECAAPTTVDKSE